MGLRLQFSKNTGDHILTDVMSNSPAWRAGIRDRHRLLQVNKTKTTGLSSLFRGLNFDTI